MSSNVQQKLFEFSELPPSSAWEGIVAALDEVPAYAQKLKAYEQVPPARIWDAVAQQLSTPQAKLISLRTNVFKYAIAAAVLLAVASASIFYLTHSNGPDLASQSQPASAGKEKNSLVDTELHSGALSRQQDETIESSNDRNATNAVTENGLVHFAPRVRIGKQLRLLARPLKVLPAEKHIINTELANRYMIATTSAGAAVRLPKKAYSEYACANAYTNTYCKEKIASIQSKMAASVSTDFTDFIDLLKNLEEN